MPPARRNQPRSQHPSSPPAVTSSRAPVVEDLTPEEELELDRQADGLRGEPGQAAAGAPGAETDPDGEPQGDEPDSDAGEQMPDPEPDSGDEAPICGECFASVWPAGTYTAGCTHGQWRRPDPRAPRE